MRDDEWLREGGERPLTRRGGMPGQAGGGEAGGEQDGWDETAGGEQPPVAGGDGMRVGCYATWREVQVRATRIGRRVTHTDEWGGPANAESGAHCRRTSAGRGATRRPRHVGGPCGGGRPPRRPPASGCPVGPAVCTRRVACPQVTAARTSASRGCACAPCR